MKDQVLHIYIYIIFVNIDSCVFMNHRCLDGVLRSLIMKYYIFYRCSQMISSQRATAIVKIPCCHYF